MFKNLVRDWSGEGAPERTQSYGRLLSELRARLPPPALAPAIADEGGPSSSSPPPPPPRVLVPGAGQGRLCLEAAMQVSHGSPAGMERAVVLKSQPAGS